MEELCNLEITVPLIIIDDDICSKHLIIDAMAVVQALIHTSSITTCLELSNAFSNYRLSVDYIQIWEVKFDNYQKHYNNIKDAMRYGDNLMSQGAMGVKIKDTTLIKDAKKS